MTDLELIEKYVSQDKKEEAKEKLNAGYPVQYIIGNVEFYGNKINVNEDVLIPRFETEYLVEKTLKYIDKIKLDNPDILEIGTGSGCISIALKKEINCFVDAIDISEKALNTAILNAKANAVEINFKLCDIHDFLSEKKYDLIISNPPYVPYNSSYDKKILYEPKNAIFAKDDGIYFYKIILDKIKNNLKDNFLIAFEIGDGEGNQIKELAQQKFPNAYVIIEKDLNNYERYLFISNKKLKN